MKKNDDYIIVRDDFSMKAHICTDRTALQPVVEYSPDECMQDPIIISRLNNVTYGFQSNDAGELFSDETIPDSSISETTIQTRSQPLHEIRFEQGKVVFTKDPTYPRIQKITVYDYNGQFVKEIRFSYYNRTGQRYFLDNIVMTDRHGEAKESYSFSYERPTNLPDTGNRSIDFWGYFNGVFRPDSETLVPQQTIEVTRWKPKFIGDYEWPVGIERTKNINITIGSELSREPDEEYMKYGTLTGITYPTGSTDEFIYEAHRYKDTEDNIKQAGGLRVRQIRTKNADGIMKTRTFTYGRREDGCGTPLTTSILDYFRLVQGMYFCEVFNAVLSGNGEWVYCPIANEYCTARQRTFFSSPTRPITFDGGTSVMYDYVTEYNGTPEDNSGKTVYEYAIDRTHVMPDDNDAMQRNQHNGWMYGQLLAKTVYRNDGAQYTPLEETANGYVTLNKNHGKILIGEASADNVIRESNINATPLDAELGYSYSRTEIEVRAQLPAWTKHTTFINGEKYSTLTTYEYADTFTNYPTRIIETGRDGVKYETNLTYPRDYGNTFPYADMVERNIMSPVIRKEYTRGNKYLGIETPYSVPFANVYQPENAIIRHSPSENGDTRFTYLYDDYGRKCQETKDDKETIVYLYGYSNQYIIACIENSTYEEVITKLGGKEAVKRNALAKSPFMHTINNLRHILPDARVTTYTYKPLVGVASVTDPMGLTTGYEYDDLGRLVKTYIINGKRQELLERNEYHYTNQ